MHKLFKNYKSFSRNMGSIKKLLVGRSQSKSDLKSSDFVVTFRHEGDIRIKVPRFGLLDFLSKKKRETIYKTYDFNKRTEAEALLREVVHTLYASGTLSADKSIIDIGAWIGDNSLVWSRLLNPETARVYAIDPSAANIAFGQEVAALNGIDNISWHAAACSDQDGRKLYYEGAIAHTRFNEDGIGKLSPVETTTLDTIVGAGNWGSIGLIHIDVEGMEKKVLAGARNILRDSRPIVVYEQHICEEDPLAVFDPLKSDDYRLYWINEVLLESSLDCRNFVAVPNELKDLSLPDVDVIKGRERGVWYATYDKALIQVDV